MSVQDTDKSNKKKIRQIKITKDVNPYSEGSVIVEYGRTKVLVTVIVENSVPSFLRNSGKGWLTAEYSMLPSSTHTRMKRERKGLSGRAHEIQRLIGRSLRMAIDLNKIGEKTFYIDCDVIIADGGTRTASITGGQVALSLAVKKLLASEDLKENPLTEQVAALSVGIDKEGEVIVDLDYLEDSSCDTDMNIVMTKSGKFIEIQGTAEGEAFSKKELDSLIENAERGLKDIFLVQDQVIGI